MTLDNTQLTAPDSVTSVAEPEKPARQRNVSQKAVEGLLVKLTFSAEADCHQPYLEDNEVGAYDLSVDKSGNLLAVAIDVKSSFKDKAYIPCPQNLMTITTTGEYSLEVGARFYGGAVMIGHKRLRQIAKERLGRHEIFIAADYATGAFLHEETGSPVAVAIKTCNMPRVYAALRTIFPNAFIVACLNFESNKHRMRKKVIDEINLSGGVALAPRFSLKERFNGLVSFNDQAMFHENRDMVMENILNLIQYAQDLRQGEPADSGGKPPARPQKFPSISSKKSGAAKSSASKSKKKPISRKPSACPQEVSI